jgi:transposase
MQKQYIVTLTPEEREQLETIITKGNNKARTIKHQNILLKADQGDNRPSWSDTEIATAFNAGRATIERLRKRFVEEGFDSALKPIKESNNRSPRKLDGYQEAQLITLACSNPPDGHCQGLFDY